MLPLLSVVQLINSTPDAQEMASEATRTIPFSLVLQKLSSFRLLVKSSILCYSWSLTF